MNKDERKQLREQIDRIAFNMIDTIEGMVDTMKSSSSPALPKPTAAVARRQLANTLRLSQFCAYSKCRRARCCRGEPLDCLNMGLPLLPPGALDTLARQRPARRRRRAPGPLQ